MVGRVEIPKSSETDESFGSRSSWDTIDCYFRIMGIDLVGDVQQWFYYEGVNGCVRNRRKLINLLHITCDGGSNLADVNKGVNSYRRLGILILVKELIRR